MSRRIRRSRTGCLRCRARKKKCDERRPSCLACERHEWLCEFDQQSMHNGLRSTDDIHDEELGSAELEGELIMSLPAWNMPVLLGINSFAEPDIHRIFNDSISKTFMEHFVHETASRLSALKDTANPFLSETLPMARTNKGLMHAILALSGQHYATRIGATDNSRVWSHYLSALSEVKAGIAKYMDGNSAELPILLTSTLMLCFVANTSSTRSDMLHHLSASESLLRDLLDSTNAGRNSHTVGFLAELYLYMASVYMISPRPAWSNLINDENSTLYKSDVFGHRSAGVLLGGHAELFRMIPCVSLLAFERANDQSAFGMHSSESLDLYSSLRRRVLTWSSTTDSTDEDVLLCGQLYQQAILIHLETAFRRLDHNSYKSTHLRRFVDNIIDSSMRTLERFPVDARITTTTIWPLMVIGANAQKLDHRKAIEKRFSFLTGRIQMKSVTDCLKILQNFWNVQDGLYSDAWCLEDYMNQQGQCVPFT